MSELDERIFGPRLVANNDGPLIFSPARLPDPATIPPRQWLLGTQLLRGFVSVLVAPGGTGKSILAMTMALSLATGQKLLGLHVFERCNAAVFNEDPLDELDRRLAAIVIRHKIDPTEVEGHLFLNSMDDRGIRMAERSPDGFTVVHPDEAVLIQQIRDNKIGLLVVDPYAESHTLEENSNPDMVRAAKAWRRVARQAGCAILLVHHVRKGGEGGIDAARGAKGLTDSARVGLVMSTMSEEEAKALSVPVEDRFRHVRIDDGKVNLSPRVDKATWFRLETVELGNESDIYPNGDRVAAIVCWEPPKLFAKVSIDQVNLVMDRIAAGQTSGVLFSPTKRGGSERWAGTAVLEILDDVSEEQASLMITAWLKSGLLVESTFRHPTSRRDQKGVLVCDEKRPADV